MATLPVNRGEYLPTEEWFEQWKHGMSISRCPHTSFRTVISQDAYSTVTKTVIGQRLCWHIAYLQITSLWDASKANISLMFKTRQIVQTLHSNIFSIFSQSHHNSLCCILIQKTASAIYYMGWQGEMYHVFAFIQENLAGWRRICRSSGNSKSKWNGPALVGDRLSANWISYLHFSM